MIRTSSSSDHHQSILFVFFTCYTVRDDFIFYHLFSAVRDIWSIPHNVVNNYVLSGWSLLSTFICINPIRDETVPISPTSQFGNRPAQRKPGGIQWMALLRSDILLRMERTSRRTCLRSWERLQEETWAYQDNSKQNVSHFTLMPFSIVCTLEHTVCISCFLNELHRDLNIWNKVATWTPVFSSVSPTSLKLLLQQQQNTKWPKKQIIRSDCRSIFRK